MEQYDPTKVQVMVDDHTLVGFAEGSKVEGERNTEKRETYVGVDGHATFVKSADDTGQVTITLKHNSPSNEKLNELYKSDDEFEFAVVDANFSGGDVGVAGTRCVVQNKPTFERTDSMAENEWVLLIADYEDSFENVL